MLPTPAPAEAYRVWGAWQGVESLRAATAAKLKTAAATAVDRRRPLVRKSTKAQEVKLFNPQFEEEFAPGKDFDPDR